MNTPVSFELAKLLKEKGFDEVTDLIYMTNHTTEVLFENVNSLKHSDGNNPFISAPTIAEVVMWLYEKHGIWITVWSAYNNSYKFSYGILHRKNIVVFHETNFDEKDSPTEAYEAAIEYTLNNLI